MGTARGGGDVSAPQLDPAVERRISVRHRGNVKIVAEGEPALATIHNISREGVGFFLGHNLETGAAVQVELLNSGASFWHLKATRVIHVTPQQEGIWLIGTVFFHPLTETELQDLLRSAG
jgi:hypothetical protein